MTSDLLRLTVLGSATPYASVDNPCSGYLVSSGGTRVWVDAGSGTLAQLQRYVRLDELDAIWISHLHADHSADLLTAYYAVLFADIQLAAPIPLYGPLGIADRLAHFLTGDTASAARAGRLIVTHVGRFLTPQQAVARASARFDGPVDYAAPGATFGTVNRSV
ncbi:MBL fold metallo-hydrolase [Streptomyces hawaiiensis]|uniref:MBL fold metallo-hydrolase n=1 Tax=Streptomyces hawaiiensis TaxID=67305 RepID=UPI00366497F2